MQFPCALFFIGGFLGSLLPSGEWRAGGSSSTRMLLFLDWVWEAESVGCTRLHGGLLFVRDDVLVRGLVALWPRDACVLVLSVCCFVLLVCFICFVCLVACVLF